MQKNIGYNSYSNKLALNLQEVFEQQLELENKSTCDEIKERFPHKKIREKIKCTWVCKDPLFCFIFYGASNMDTGEIDPNDIYNADTDTVKSLVPNYRDYIYEVDLTNLYAIANIHDDNDLLVAEYKNQQEYKRASNSG